MGAVFPFVLGARAAGKRQSESCGGVLRGNGIRLPIARGSYSCPTSKLAAKRQRHTTRSPSALGARSALDRRSRSSLRPNPQRPNRQPVEASEDRTLPMPNWRPDVPARRPSALQTPERTRSIHRRRPSRGAHEPMARRTSSGPTVRTAGAQSRDEARCNCGHPALAARCPRLPILRSIHQEERTTRRSSHFAFANFAARRFRRRAGFDFAFGL